jgi:Holliday junction resolvase RusA-like endonuclease
MQNYLWPWQDKTTRYGIAIRVYRSRDAGDLDNYVKAISDACNGVLWLDDSQIRRIDAMVDGCEKGRERVNVEAWTLD